MNFDRRTLLLGSVAAAAAQSAQQSPSADKVPTAFIGVGGRGSYLLGGVLQQSNAKVVALCDNKPDRLDKAATAASRDNPATTTEWRKIIDRKDVDAVYIATPPHLHSEMAVAALKAGKHVYCEKPIGITPEQVAALVAAARGSKKVFVAGQQLRSMQRFQEAVRKVRSGVIGDLLQVKAQRHATADLPHDGSSGDWYFDVSKSGGYLVEQSVHNLDLCNWIIGAHPLRASGFGSIQLYKNDPPGRTIFDNGSITYEYPNGLQLSFTQNVFHPRGLPAGNQYIQVFGSKAAIDLMGTGLIYPLARDGGPPVPMAEKTPESEHAQTEAFYKLILNGGQGENPADITIGATAALTAILGHRAMSGHKVVTWQELGVKL